MLGMSLIGAILMIVWIVILVWLSKRLLAMIARRTNWNAFDWRNWLLCFVLLVGGIWLANFALDWLDFATGTRNRPTVAPPGALLLASVGIAVPVAGIMSRRD